MPNRIFALSGLNGANGFTLNGINAGDRSGFSVASAGDINGDGLSDIIIGAWGATASNRTQAGQSYVIFGKRSGWNAILNLSFLNGSNGFVLNGINAGDESGYHVASAGDINGDHFSDLIIGARYYNQNTLMNDYVIFGKPEGWNATMELSSLNGSNGFKLSGILGGDQNGLPVASAGDFNGDGFSDVLIGVQAATAPNNRDDAGQTYLIFGKHTWEASFNIAALNGTNGFVLNGINAQDSSGYSVASVGDVNDDGFDDVIIGANYPSPNNQTNAGQSYVVFGKMKDGKTNFELSSLNGTNGFTVNGIHSGDYIGVSVASAGDINGDNIADVIIGGSYANNHAGQCYVVFGKTGNWNTTLELSSLNGQNGFILNGINALDFAGNSVASAGDVNGDGLSDLLIGAPGANNQAGQSYVVFGSHGPWNATFNLASLNGVNGIILNGTKAGSDMGDSVASAGDINGDGFADIIIGAWNANLNNKTTAGQSYAIFGGCELFLANRLNVQKGDSVRLNVADLSVNPMIDERLFTVTDISHGQFELASNPGVAVTQFIQQQIASGQIIFFHDGSQIAPSYTVSAQRITRVLCDVLPQVANITFSLNPSFNPSMKSSVELSSLNGMNGFAINGIASSNQIGTFVASAGDINSDGISDIAIGAYLASPNMTRSLAGQSYVIFGKANPWPAAMNLSSLNGSNGFTLNGINANDWSGRSILPANDVNGDKVSDIIISAWGASPNGNYRAGQHYVIFGRTGVWGATLELSALNGANGFMLNGVNANDQMSAILMSSASDINGDGLSDVIIGSGGASPNNKTQAGQSYVVFGKSTPWEAVLNLSAINGINGFMINGIKANDRSGWAVSTAGDINGDGISDIIIGARDADLNGKTQVGQNYIIFGHRGSWDAILELSALNGINGVTLNGINAGDSSGLRVALAGDVNGDGLSDVIIGAWQASPNGYQSGQSYVVFGRSGIWPAAINLSSLNGITGFILNGVAAGDVSGWSVASAGDINNDGFSDIIVGAYNANSNNIKSGQSYIVLGKRNTWNASIELSSLDGTDGFKLNGINSGDQSGFAVASVGDVNRDGLSDVSIGACSASPNYQTKTGQTYIVFGDMTAPPSWIGPNQLNITSGQTITLNKTHIGLRSFNYKGELTLSLSNVTHGQFELSTNPGQAVTEFTRTNLHSGMVKFVHDGSLLPPSYSITLSSGIGLANLASPLSAHINFVPRNLTASASISTTGFFSSSAKPTTVAIPPAASSSSSTILPIAAGAAAGGVLLLTAGFFYRRHRRNKANANRVGLDPALSGNRDTLDMQANPLRIQMDPAIIAETGTDWDPDAYYMGREGQKWDKLTYTTSSDTKTRKSNRVSRYEEVLDLNLNLTSTKTTEFHSYDSPYNQPNPYTDLATGNTYDITSPDQPTGWNKATYETGEEQSWDASNYDTALGTDSATTIKIKVR